MGKQSLEVAFNLQDINSFQFKVFLNWLLVYFEMFYFSGNSHCKTFLFILAKKSPKLLFPHLFKTNSSNFPKTNIFADLILSWAFNIQHFAQIIEKCPQAKPTMLATLWNYPIKKKICRRFILKVCLLTYIDKTRQIVFMSPKFNSNCAGM